MNEFEGSGEAFAEAARYVVEHHGSVLDGKIPELTTNLLFCDVSSCHLNNGAPCTLGKAIG